ncbi:hypothetical protein [Natronomonas marina]|uniref:hypothetical protein n=1 Tax=Natronomonas marina TaxID=2961939 RepID=UPI0020C9B9DC|nr:hypothetical protein [Natronomonas marina]
MDEVADEYEVGDVVEIEFGGDYGVHRGEVVGLHPGVGSEDEYEIDVQLADAGASSAAPAEEHFLIDLVGVQWVGEGRPNAVGETVNGYTEEMGTVERIKVVGEVAEA